MQAIAAPRLSASLSPDDPLSELSEQPRARATPSAARESRAFTAAQRSGRAHPSGLVRRQRLRSSKYTGFLRFVCSIRLLLFHGGGGVLERGTALPAGLDPEVAQRPRDRPGHVALRGVNAQVGDRVPRLELVGAALSRGPVTGRLGAELGDDQGE